MPERNWNAEERKWKSKDGEVLISEMSDEHLQNALVHAEHRFMLNHNEMLKYSANADLFSRKMIELQEEARFRGVKLTSLCDKKIGKNYPIIRNAYRVHFEIDEE